jgi:hypothetical protein
MKSGQIQQPPKSKQCVPKKTGGGDNLIMKGGAIDMTYLFNNVSTPFFPSSNYMNPIVSNGTTAGAITSNSILTGNAVVTNPSQLVASKNNIGEYLV